MERVDVFFWRGTAVLIGDWRGFFTLGFTWNFGNFNPVIRRPCGFLDVPWVSQGEQGWREGEMEGGRGGGCEVGGVNGRFIYHRCHSLPERKSALPNWNIAEFTLLIRGSACATVGDGRRAARGYHQRVRRRRRWRGWHLIGCGLMWQPGFSGSMRERERVSGRIVPSGNTRGKYADYSFNWFG